MKAVVRSIGTQFGDDLESVRFPDPTDFETTVRVVIGPDSEESGEYFDFRVCSVARMKKRCEGERFVLGAKWLIVLAWDVKLIREAIAQVVERVSGDSWDELSAKLAALSLWEFEGYRPSSS